MNINDTMKELAEHIRLGEEVTARIEGLRDTLRAHMQDTGVDVLIGSEHKASLKEVTSSRIDTTALKQNAPDVAAQYTKTTTGKRFLFV